MCWFGVRCPTFRRDRLLQLLCVSVLFLTVLRVGDLPVAVRADDAPSKSTAGESTSQPAAELPSDASGASEEPVKAAESASPASATTSESPEPSSAQNPSATNLRGMKPDPDSVQGASAKYRSRRAVVVGINYSGWEGPPRSLTELKNAEYDAEDFYQLLKDYYGFREEDIVLLTGKKATKTAIWDEVSRLLVDDVTDEDCVLFYFSGHGIVRSDVNNLGELLPYDVTCENGQPPSVNQNILMDDLVNRLEKHSKARHKLLILDSCYAGAVLSHESKSTSPRGGVLAGEGRRVGQFGDQRVGQTAFDLPGFQAMTASSLEPASDVARSGSTGEAGHSPFTAALLSALKYLPTMKGEHAKMTTTQVFSGMQNYLDATLNSGQSPRCAWLNSSQGEFHFFLEGTLPDFQRPDDQIRRNMIAMVPGSFGNWWFDECPWFLPSLRYEIIADSSDSRSSMLEVISTHQLEEAALKMWDRLSGSKSAVMQQRLRDMKLLMQNSGEEWIENARAIRDRLQAMRNQFKEKAASESESQMEAVDLHLLAVLQHALREDLPDAQECYQAAVKKYEEEARVNPQVKALLALCLADFGWFESSVAYNFDKASQNFIKAINVYGATTPQPFAVYVLCRDAEAQLHLGREGVANRRLEEALQAIKEVDPNREYPLSAAYYHRRAWLRMTSCKYSDAIEDFKESSRILTHMMTGGQESQTPNFIENIEAQIIYLHNEHGIAMATRFLGNRDEAISRYRSLYSDIIDNFIKLRVSDSRETNYRQTKGRLIERLVNTQERLADCSLFGQPMDVVEAADDYRRGLRACGYLLPEKRVKFIQRLRIKYALTLALPNTPIHDPEAAREQLRLLNVIHAATLQGQNGSSGTQSDRTAGQRSIHLCRMLTELLLSIYSEPQPTSQNEDEVGESTPSLAQACEKLNALRRDLAEYLDSDRLNRTLTRDDIEVSLFCLKLLLTDLREPVARIDAQAEIPARLIREEDIAMLVGFCRSARRGSLHYARPYYDCAIQAMIDMNPPHVKELVDVAHEALQGQIHRKSATPEVILMVYCSSPSSYVLLDIPQSTSACYKLPGDVNASTLRRAVAENLKLDLPAEVYKELALAVVRELPVNVCWQDPVQEIGEVPAGSVRVTVLRPSFNSEELSGTSRSSSATALQFAEIEFPFEVPAGVELRSNFNAGKKVTGSSSHSDSDSPVVDEKSTQEGSNPDSSTVTLQP